MKYIITAAFVFQLLLFSGTLYAEAPESGIRVGAFGSFGGYVNEVNGWNLDFNITDIYVPPGVYWGGGIMVGPFPASQATEFFLSTEIGTTNVSGTGQAQMGNISGTVELDRTPAMIWFTLSSKGKLCPVFRVGAGASRIHLGESYPSLSSANVDIDYWTASMGIGGGLTYKLSPRVEVWTNFDAVIDTSMENEIRPVSGIETGMHGFSGFVNGSLRVVLWF